MAEVADICTESTPVDTEEASDCHIDKGIEKTCDLVTGKVEICGKGDSGPTDSSGNETDEAMATTENISPANAETELTAPEVTADTTDGTPTGIKRKCEEDEKEPEVSDDVKKVKTDDAVAVTDESEADPKVAVNGSDNNGCHETEATNGKDVQDIPAEIVTKTVEEAMKSCSEDVVA
jgi:hypothetical protein